MDKLHFLDVESQIMVNDLMWTLAGTWNRSILQVLGVLKVVDPYVEDHVEVAGAVLSTMLSMLLPCLVVIAGIVLVFLAMACFIFVDVGRAPHASVGVPPPTEHRQKTE